MAAQPQVQDKLVTADEYWAFVELPENEGKYFELIGGVIVEMAGSSPLNTVLAGRIITYLNMHVMPADLGFVSGPDRGYELAPHQVSLPDVGYISKARQPTLPKRFTVAPDLAVEVISPSETHKTIITTIKAYLRAGTRLVWCVYPEDKEVEIYRLMADNALNVRTLNTGGTLEGEDVLPGFSLAVEKLFANLSQPEAPKPEDAKLESATDRT